MEIIDLYGNVIKRVLIDTEPGFNTHKIDILDLSVGTYLIREQEGKVTKQFVIME